MKLLNRLKFSTKLIVMLFFPIIGLLFFSVSTTLEKYQMMNELESLQSLAELSKITSEFVHETQKERGATAVFVGSEGTKFEQELKKQRKSSDTKIELFRGYLENFDNTLYDTKFNGILKKAVSSLDEMKSLRSNVDNLSASGPEAIGYYTNLHKEMFDVIGYISKITTNAELSTLMAAYFNFINGKERAGIERAVLSATFANDQFAPGMLEKFITLIAEQTTYYNVFLNYSSEEQRKFYIENLNIKEDDEVNRMRKVALEFSSEGGFNIDASYWFKTITTKINALKNIEDKLSTDLSTSAGTIKEDAFSTLIFSLSASLIILLLTVLLSIVISRNILRQLGGEPQEVFEIASQISEGDLTYKFDNSKESVGLYGAMKNMAEKLNQVMEAVKSASDQIANASDEMNSSSQQMSEGATEQASSAEEVSSSMEEMAANIQQNTDNAKETEKIAVSSAESIKESSVSVNLTVDSMKTIADKISIIGEISRQTNLLALNAAVEAARAGEHGKGFAVVAAEIRRLAERSQAAATEIDEVSASSVEIAQKSGKMLEDVAPEIQKTSDLVREITSASIEQNSGANQINGAIQQLNQIVQQNAAGAEEMAANSEELNAQAEMLKETISFFTLDDTNEPSTKKVIKAKPVAKPKKNGAPKGNGKVKSLKKAAAAVDIDLGTTSNVLDNEYEKF